MKPPLHVTWIWYLLSQHPEVEQRLHEEVDRVLGGQPPTVDRLEDLPYTRRVLQETMRLYPRPFLSSAMRLLLTRLEAILLRPIV